MFTGIIEDVGTVTQIIPNKGNLDLSIRSAFTAELDIDQSVAHNGACLTVVAVKGDEYTVTAIQETLAKTNLSHLQPGSPVNLERAMIMGTRLDGHLVQGHVDQTAQVSYIKEQEGSWMFGFEYDSAQGNLTIEKGSITVNGVSLTVVNSGLGSFSVAVIPYTYEHTVFSKLREHDVVNLEFDVIGKYVGRFMQLKG